MTDGQRAPRNRTLTITGPEIDSLSLRTNRWSARQCVSDVLDTVVCQDIHEASRFLPDEPFVDLLFLDPPYNMEKSFNGRKFKRLDDDAYGEWLAAVIDPLVPVLKPTASVYVCSTWESSGVLTGVLGSRFHIRNRITWEREKGRGAARNWKNASEDIWFCTVSDSFTFNVEAVKLKKRVIAPYTDSSGTPKDWQDESDGRFRLTHPSNLWTDLTVPFWSMPENTDHPTQKPEKLLAKLVLASTNTGDVVFDPFLGSGTSAVVAHKLGRRFLGIEIDPKYCALAVKRLERVEHDPAIQGYVDGLFWERNSAPRPDSSTTRRAARTSQRGSR